jgi:nucleoid DNA-binding protein
MSQLTKRDLVMRISNETGMVQRDVHMVIQRMLDCLVEGLARGQRIELRQFGSFEARLRKARVGRNPRHPAHNIPIPPRFTVKFKASNEMKAVVKKLSRAMAGDSGTSA